MSHGVTNQIEKTGKGNIEYSDHSSKSEILNNICVSYNSSQPTNKPNLTSLKPEEIPLNKLGLEFFFQHCDQSNAVGLHKFSEKESCHCPVCIGSPIGFSGSGIWLISRPGFRI